MDSLAGLACGILIAAAFGAVLLGIPVAFALSGASLIVAGVAALFDVFDDFFPIGYPFAHLWHRDVQRDTDGCAAFHPDGGDHGVRLRR